MADARPQQPDFRQLFEAVPAAYLVLTPELVIVGASDAYLGVTMTVREEIVGRGLFEVFPDSSGAAGSGEQRVRDSIGRAVARRKPDTMPVLKYGIPRPSSSGGGFEERYWVSTNYPVLGANGEVSYIIHAAEDVTDFVRSKGDNVSIETIAGGFKNRADHLAAAILQRGQGIFDANLRLQDLHDDLELRLQARTADFELATEALARSEEQLRQAQKLEALGRLAGGIAHDFNNMLSAILSYSDLLAEQLPEGTDAHEDLQQIRNAGQRAAHLTRQLLAFSRQQMLEPKVLNLNEVIDAAVAMLARLLGEDIELRTLPGPDLGTIEADRSQIDQVILNLAVNSRDAMPTGGKLTLQTENIELNEAHRAQELGLRRGSYVGLRVSDTGVGIDKAVQERIFEPFFTTKEQGKGTGLGLATVFGIMKQSGGTVAVHSEPGAGATFTLYFPRTARVPRRSEAPPPRASGHEGDGETVLLVEDESQVRSVASLILRRAGYTVLEAANGIEALRVAANHRGAIDLLLTDVVMPELGGRELAERLARDRPTTAVLFMSGYTDDAVIHHGVSDQGLAFLQKPLTPTSLLGKVREVLDAARTYRRGDCARRSVE